MEPERKRKSRWDQSTSNAPAISTPREAAEHAASSVVAHGPQHEAVLKEQAQNDPLYAWLLDPTTADHGYYQQRLKVLRAQKQAELLTSQLASKQQQQQQQAAAAAVAAVPTAVDIAAVAKAAAASVGVLAARAPPPPALPSGTLLQAMDSGGVMASSGVGRVFYPPTNQAPAKPEGGAFGMLPPKPEGGGFAAAPGGVGRVFYPPTLEEQQAARAGKEAGARAEAEAPPPAAEHADEPPADPPRRRRRGFREEAPDGGGGGGGGGEERREEPRKRRGFREERPAEREAASSELMPPPAPPPRRALPPVPTFGGGTSSGGAPQGADVDAANDDLTQFGLLPRASAEAQPPAAGFGGESGSRWGGNTNLNAYIPPEELAKLTPGAAAAARAAAGVAAGPAVGDGNLGHQMLASMGWSEGRGLGARGDGIVTPVAGGRPEDKSRPGLGVGESGAAGAADDAFELYKKRMSLGYQYRAAAAQAGPQNTAMPGTVPPPRADRR